MSAQKPFLPLWPFVVADAVFIGIALVILNAGHRPLPWQEAGLLVVCGALGAWSFLTPFLRRGEDEQALAQARLLADAAGQIQNLDQLAAQIRGATNQWLELQGHTTEAAASARQVAERMSAEAKAFAEFMQRASETERTHLRIEAEKLRRTDAERLQVIIHLLDHVHALFQAARHSGQPALLEQIGHFQNACHEAVRRMGLTPVLGQPGTPFDEKLHQLPPDASPEENALIVDTLVSGYAYQGQLLRRPVVALKVPDDEAPTAKE